MIRKIKSWFYWRNQPSTDTLLAQVIDEILSENLTLDDWYDEMIEREYQEMKGRL